MSFLERFEAARELAARFGVRLVDWFACDGELLWPARLRTLRMDEQPDWWDVGEGPELRIRADRQLVKLVSVEGAPTAD